MIHWDGPLIISRAKSFLSCRWLEGTKESVRFFNGWSGVADYMMGIGGEWYEQPFIPSSGESMIKWTGSMTVEQTENGLVFRWWEGTKERSRVFSSWYDAADYFTPPPASVAFNPLPCHPPGEPRHHPMMAEAIRAADCRGDY